MNLLFDFTVDKAANTIHITREFAADLDLVWDAFTKVEILEQWMAPKPWRIKTKEMDFREGGRWLYAMISTENAARNCLAEFVRIEPKSSFTTRNSFCDENGNEINTGFTSSLTTNSFKAEAGKTTLQIVKKMASLSELEQFIAGGMYKEGITMGMRNLDEYLLALVTNK
jgi:uncharacterized protein YndB with AHSA1/START domain